MLSNLKASSSKSNDNVNYDIRIEDVLGIDRVEEESIATDELREGSDTEEGKNSDSTERPNVFKGLWGELSSGFGLF